MSGELQTTGERVRDRRSVDILIVRGLVVTMSVDRTIIEDGAVAIKDGAIVDMGQSAQLQLRYSADRVMDANGKVVMPGLINAHTHASMTLLRGLADDVALHVWLENHIWPAEAKFMNADTVVLGATVGFAEMVRSGTTTFNDMYFFADEIAMAAKNFGIRAVVGEGILDFPTPAMGSPQAALARTEELILKWQSDPLIRIAVAPHSPYSCSQEVLVQSQRLAQKYKVPLHIHVAETKREVDEAIAKTGLSPVAYLHEMGFLDMVVVAAHCVHVTSHDIGLLVEHGVGVVHCPKSNCKLGSGVAPIADLLAAGGHVGLGTDGAASNNRLDLFAEMGFAALLHKGVRMDPLAMDAYTMLEMATIGGARALGMAGAIGSLETGKRADILFIDMDAPNMKPMYDVVSHLVYAIDAGNVDTVIIDGRIIMEDRQLLTLNESATLDDVTSLGAKIRAARG
ncbi:MAG: amidohydrolase [Firmicutes bacterium]|nr:amidohydrolase [Bacillota bacterium]